MISITQDFTAQYADDKTINLDVSGWDYIVVQFESVAVAAVNFNTTNDSGAVQGISDGNANTATGWQPVQGINVATGTGATSAAVGSSIWRFQYIGRFLQLTSGSGTISKLLVSFNKIG